uniref:Fe2OG dioxygenase domain-containing protein n=1 Tax=Kalanchoe fedtschenkoi TaxID=63787 RepID=A0A7N0UIQ7_KALFE
MAGRRVTASSVAHQGPPQVVSMKKLTESSGLTFVPPTHIFTTDGSVSTTDGSVPESPSGIPVINFSSLTSSQRSVEVEKLAQACRDWGFFLVVNHGIEENIVDGMLDGVRQFFNLAEEEKQQFEGKHVLDPIRCGTSFNVSVEKCFFWRDYLKVFVHPHFHFPHIPSGFRVREVARVVLTGISESLGLEPNCLEEALDYDAAFQIFIANLYPPCPQPELALGMPPHSDHGCLTFLIQNGIQGLQVLHNGNWVTVSAPQNAFLVNTGDQLEIMSNGRYKSNVHRVVVNSKATRISIAVAHGPSLETVVQPAAELVDAENGNPAGYKPMQYKEYLQLQQSNQLDGKSCLDRIRV